MSDEPISNSISEDARVFISGTWRRARINAFAHRIAHEKAIRKARRFETIRVVATLLSLFSIIAIFIFSSTDGGLLTLMPESKRKVFAFLATVTSIVLTFVSLYFDYANTVGEYRAAAHEHKYLLGSYQHIAQRAREARWPDRSPERLVELLHDLEKDFQLLKARGTEPPDEIFVQANKLFASISAEPVARTAQSFPSAEPYVEDGAEEPPSV